MGTQDESVRDLRLGSARNHYPLRRPPSKTHVQILAMSETTPRLSEYKVIKKVHQYPLRERENLYTANMRKDKENLIREQQKNEQLRMKLQSFKHQMSALERPKKRIPLRQARLPPPRPKSRSRSASKSKSFDLRSQNSSQQSGRKLGLGALLHPKLLESRFESHPIGGRTRSLSSGQKRCASVKGKSPVATKCRSTKNLWKQSPYAKPLSIQRNKEKQQSKEKSSLLNNLDKLMKLVKKHCDECPKFMKEFQDLGI